VNKLYIVHILRYDTVQATNVLPKCSQPDDVVIKVDCSTITLQDCMVRRGKWIDLPSLPYVPGTDIVGTICELGSSSQLQSRFRVGDLVAAVIPSGGNAKYVKCKARELILIPNGVDPVTALCISSTYVPAKQCLEVSRSEGTPLTGANVLVIFSSGPTQLATIDLCLLEGANVYAIADARHHQHLQSIGVTKCFPVNPKEWIPKLQGKMDVVFDSVCVDGYESSAKALAPGGKLVCSGMSATFTQGPINGLLFGYDFRLLTALYQKAIVKYNIMRNAFYYDKVESFRDRKAVYDQHFRYLCHVSLRGELKPVVAARASLSMVGSLQQAIERGTAPYGVCVATPWLTREDL
jgi:NADPH:quinone reductase-like Zn-dependent oxidoreductase